MPYAVQVIEADGKDIHEGLDMVSALKIDTHQELKSFKTTMCTFFNDKERLSLLA